MRELLTTKGIPFRKEEIDSFTKYAMDKTGEYVEYEDYVAKLVEENERHLEYLLQDWYAMNQKKWSNPSTTSPLHLKMHV